MKRRDFLKHTGALAVGLPAMAASQSVSSSASKASAAVKDLIVTLTGPFCYWLEGSGLKIMAPHVGPNFHAAPHQPWTGTSANQIMIVGSETDYRLAIGPRPLKTAMPIAQGTPIFGYGQGPNPRPPMFSFLLPMPDAMSGNQPTLAQMQCVNPDEPYCKTPTLYASSLTIVYNNVDPTQVAVTQGNQTYFTPCFENDANLPVLRLGIHMTPLRRDSGHLQAQQTWKQMLALYPWMQQEITGITLCEFNTAACPPTPTCLPEPKKKAPRRHRPGPDIFFVGPGNNCESPIMLLTPGGQALGGKKK